jgi:hypothetical protein
LISNPGSVSGESAEENAFMLEKKEKNGEKTTEGRAKLHN